MPDLGRHATREEQLHRPAALVERNNARARLLRQGLSQFGRIAFDREIQIANLKAAEHVPHGSAGQKQAEIRTRAAACTSATTRFWSVLR